MKTMIAKSALALPLLAGALWISGAPANATPTSAPDPTVTPTEQPKPGKGKGKDDDEHDDGPRAPRTNPTRSTFSYPLNNITVTVNGQTVRLSGALSGVAMTNQDAAGGLHIRATVDARNLVVTLANGTVLRGVGTANVVANIGAPKGAASVAMASAVINLAGPNNTAYRLNVRLKLTVNANNEVTVAILRATLTTVNSTNNS